MLWQRTVTGLIGLVVAIYTIGTGGWLFCGVITLLALFGWHEYVNMIRQKGIGIPAAFGFLAITFLMIISWLNWFNVAFIGVTIFTLILFSGPVLRYGKFTLEQLAFTLYGVVYLAFGFFAILSLRNTALYDLLGHFQFLSLEDKGYFFLWLTLLSTWASDTFAYIVGRLVGKHKLCPAISPGKTKEGFLGGVAGTIITAVLFSAAVGFPVGHAFNIGFLVAVFAPLGDLVESVLKRTCGVKDSGRIFPGHGGVLDRFDSLLFVAPAVFSYILLAG